MQLTCLFNLTLTIINGDGKIVNGVKPEPGNILLYYTGNNHYDWLNPKSYLDEVDEINPRIDYGEEIEEEYSSGEETTLPLRHMLKSNMLYEETDGEEESDDDEDSEFDGEEESDEESDEEEGSDDDEEEEKVDEKGVNDETQKLLESSDDEESSGEEEKEEEEEEVGVAKRKTRTNVKRKKIKIC